MLSGHYDKPLILMIAIVVIVSLGIAGALAYAGHDGAIAAFTGVAIAALGVLSPSPLKQPDQGTQVSAGPDGTVNVAAPNEGTPPTVVENGTVVRP